MPDFEVWSRFEILYDLTMDLYESEIFRFYGMAGMIYNYTSIDINVFC